MIAGGEVISSPSLEIYGHHYAEPSQLETTILICPKTGAAGLEKEGVRFHDLRHASATLMLAAGTHPKIVQEQLGHSQIGITLDTYSHCLPSMQKEAAEVLDNILRKKGG